MNNLMNDPLGAFSRGLATANSTIQTNVKKAADNIKNNEDLKQKLQYAKEKGYQGLSTAGTAATTAAGGIKEAGSNVYQQNYHGQLYENVQTAVGSMAQKAQQKVKQGQ
jgi:uncharacterized protein YbbC (DUF1343 family)